MKVKDLMTREVLTIGGEDTVESAAKILSENEFSGLPVVDVFGKVIGMITEGDLIRRASRIKGPSYLEILGGIIPLESKKNLMEDIKKSMGYLVKEVMADEVVSVKEDIEIEEAATIMVNEQLKRLPVVDEKGILIGIISRKDIMKHLFESSEN